MQRILVVDDSVVMRRMIIKVIEMAGVEGAVIDEASDGAEALAILRDRPADLVLTDINMPGMNGEAMLRAIGENPQTAHIPVIVISTDATESRMKRMLALGAKGYLTKPFRPVALRQQLERIQKVSHAS